MCMFRYCLYVVAQETGGGTEKVDVVGDAQNLQTIGKSEHKLSSLCVSITYILTIWS